MTTATPITEAFETWYAEQASTWANNPARKQYRMTAEGVQQALKDASFLAYRAATERAAVLCEEHAATLTSVGIRSRETAEECAAAIRASGGMGRAMRTPRRLGSGLGMIMADDRYIRESAVEKIGGYMGMAHPTVSHAANFESAKAECLAALQRGVEAVLSMSYDEYVKHRKAVRAAAETSRAKGGSET